MVWWLAVSIITVVSFSLYTQHISSNQSGKSSRASTSARKVFHFIVVAVYVPGLVVDPYFLLLASMVAFSVLGVLEVGCTNQYIIVLVGKIGFVGLGTQQAQTPPIYLKIVKLQDKPVARL